VVVSLFMVVCVAVQVRVVMAEFSRAKNWRNGEDRLVR
jgi:hypothetical protein